MSHNSCSFLGALAFCLIGIFRLLFFAVLILNGLSVLISTNILRTLIKDNLVMRELWLIPMKIAICILIFAGILTLLGNYCFLSNSRKGLKLFALLTSTNALVLLLSIGWMETTNFSLSRDEKMVAYQAQYDWFVEKPERPRARATEFWDTIQRGCCGIHGSSDWDRFRPDGLANGTYPRSCCGESEGNFCTDLQHGDGCMNEIRQVDYSFALYGAIIVTLHLISAVLANCISHCARPNDRGEQVVVRGVPPQGHRNYPVFLQLNVPQQPVQSCHNFLPSSTYNPDTDYVSPHPYNSMAPPKYGSV